MKIWGRDDAWIDYEAVGRTIDRLAAQRDELRKGMKTEIGGEK